MIKANELRIGNWVNFADKPYLINELDDIRKASEFESMKPIPLTSEIIVKAGWVWNEDSVSYEKYPKGDARMHLQKREVSGSYTMFNYVLKAIIANKIFYLHQLQNLYYALTNEELEINL